MSIIRLNVHNLAVVNIQSRLLHRKIKIFPKSIARIELHAKSNRMYVQCINDPLVYAIEITSAVVIQTIKYADEGHTSLDTRNTFTVSPCESLLFTKCPSEDQIKCIRVSNEEQFGQMRIPISLATRKYSVTSLTYHPSKNLIACSIFGDVISSCLFVMYNESDVMKKEHDSRYEDDLQHDIHALEEWHNGRSQEFGDTAEVGIKSIAIDSILNRIDDLFFMAIRSPQQDDTDQFKEMQQFLEKLRLESPKMLTDGNQRSATTPNGKSDVSNKVEAYLTELSSASGESKKGEPKSNSLFEKPNVRASWQLQSTSKVSSKSDDSHSDSSHHTFEVTKPAKQKTQSKRSDDNEMSNATYSIESDMSKRSNLTFEISPTAKQ